MKIFKTKLIWQNFPEGKLFAHFGMHPNNRIAGVADNFSATNRAISLVLVEFPGSHSVPAYVYGRPE